MKKHKYKYSSRVDMAPFLAEDFALGFMFVYILYITV